MGFRQADSEGRGGYARIWSLEDKGSYSVAKISTSKKSKDNEGYETDFQDGFVRLIGAAHNKAKEIDIPDKGLSIQIKSCEVTNTYDVKAKKGYVNYAIFAFDIPENNSNSAKTSKKPAAKTSQYKPVADNEDLPF